MILGPQVHSDPRTTNMIPAEFLVMFFSLAAAVIWGAGDFSGGFATKRASVYVVVLVSQVVGLVCLPLLAIVFSEPLPPTNSLFWGFFAGLAASFGMLLLFHALSTGSMGVAAPISAVFSVALPVVYGVFNEGLPASHQIAGFVIALISILLVSGTDEMGRIRIQELVFPLLAGVGFGMFFISVDHFSETAVFWPLSVAKLSAVLVTLGVILLRRSAKVPSGDVLPLIILTGVFETTGSLFFTLALEAGRLDIATVLSSLYPGGTVLLAWFVLKERLSSKQWIGVVLALIAIVLISL